MESEKTRARQKTVLPSPGCKPERTLHAGKLYLWRQRDEVGKAHSLEAEARDLNSGFFFNKFFDFDFAVSRSNVALLLHPPLASSGTLSLDQ